MANYDIGDALHRIELLLLASMRRNLHRHLHEEQDEGFRWSMWQAEQLTAIGSWTRRNYRQYAPQFTKINQAAIGLLQQSAERAALVEEDLILRTGVQRAAGFFNAPEDKLSALTNAVRHDLSQAEHSILRQADDLYRQTLFDAHMYLQTGSGTLNNAIDTAVQDLMQRGIRSVTYRNGHRVEASVYARMALRSANVRAKLTGEGAARDKFGVHTVLVSPSGIACEQCAPWMGKVLVDDVYCTGTAQEAAEMKLPLLSDAIRQGFLHPQCNCAVHTYLPGVSKPPPPVTEQDRQNAVKRYKLTQQQRYNERQIRRWKYAEDAAPGEAAKKAAHAKVKAWQQQNQALCDAHPDELRRDYQREKIWNIPPKPVVPDCIEKERENGYFGNSEKPIDKSTKSGIMDSKKEASVKLADVPRGEPMSFEEADGHAPNPYFQRGGGFGRNCQASAAAYDARRRGFDVHAKAFTRTRAFKALADKPETAWKDPIKGTPPMPEPLKTHGNAVGFIKELNAIVKSGQRYVLTFLYNNQSNDGHVVVVERDEKGLFIYDAQSSYQYRGFHLLNYASGMDFKRTIKLFRIDQMQLNLILLNELLEG